MKISRRIVNAGAALALAAIGITAVGSASAQQPPLRIGTALAQTGPLAGGGKSVLLALQMWRDDVNAKGGLLGRKVELVVYDDQGNPANEPSIYSKLLDVDKVDLLISPYGTNPTAAIMPMIKQRDRFMVGNFAYDVNAKIKHEKYFHNAPWGQGAEAWAGAFLEPGKKLGAKSIAFLAADAEFSQNLANGARELAKKNGLNVVYDQNYPPSTVDFSSMIRAVKAAKPDLVFVASYPADSAAIVRSINEIGVGESVKMLGGAMVGLQYAASMESLGSMLNGIVNYNHYVPEKTVDNPAISDFLKRYAGLAPDLKIDPLGYYVAPFAYAAGQIIEQAANGAKSLDENAMTAYLRKNEIKTIAGPIRFSDNGEWSTAQVLGTQFQNVVNRNVDQFRQPGKQVIVYPERLKSGELRHPFEKARK